MVLLLLITFNLSRSEFDYLTGSNHCALFLGHCRQVLLFLVLAVLLRYIVCV